MSKLINSETHNGYTYDVYDNGTTIARGEIQDKMASRNGYIQRHAGGDSREPDDHGGHLVPASHNGTSNAINISAQNNKVNTKDVRGLEREELNAVRNGTKIYTERIAFHSNDPNRPDAYMFNDQITKPDGTTIVVNSSFSNINQRELDHDFGLDEAQDSYNIAKESGYSKEEYYGILKEADKMDISDYSTGWTSSSNSPQVDYTNDMSDFGKDDSDNDVEENNDSDPLNNNNKGSDSDDDSNSMSI